MRDESHEQLTAGTPTGYQPDASDQRSGGVLIPTLGTLVASEPPSTLRELLNREQRAVPAPTTSTCMNPACNKELSFPGDGRKTRPSAYCSVECRRKAEYMRERLAADLQVLTSNQHLPGSARDARAVNRAISIRRWLLKRYPE